MIHFAGFLILHCRDAMHCVSTPPREEYFLVFGGKENKRGQKKERFTKANLSKQKYVGKNYSSFNVTRLKAVAVKFLETEAMY